MIQDKFLFGMRGACKSRENGKMIDRFDHLARHCLTPPPFNLVALPQSTIYPAQSTECTKTVSSDAEWNYAWGTSCS